MVSIVVPAHNEAAVIEKCLHALLAGSSPGEFQIIVACNGCTDDTAAIARGFSTSANRIEVLEVATASKIAALNAGLEACTSTPCLFVDADVELSTDGVRSIVKALAVDGVMAASPALQLDTTGASMISRSYHRFWEQLPSIAAGLAGRGVYALNQAGLERLGTFPDVVADDRYVHLLFPPSERALVSDVRSTVAVARTARELIARKQRVFAGNNVMAATMPSVDEGSWRDVVSANPTTLRDLPAYLVVNLIAKAQARRGSTGWNRDDGSRRAE